MRKHDGMEKLDDLELDKVVGGVTVNDSWGQQISTEDFLTTESSQTESMKNFIIRKRVPKKPGPLT